MDPSSESDFQRIQTKDIMPLSLRSVALTLLLVMFSGVVVCRAALAYDDVPTSEDIAQWLIEANKGDPEAQFNLGEAYLKGEGVKKDEQVAAQWYYKSAMQDYPPAEFAMGFVYRGGGGIPMDKILSYMWFDLAAKNGDNRAFDLRNNVAWSMTEPEIEEARRKSSQWRPDKK